MNKLFHCTVGTVAIPSMLPHCKNILSLTSDEIEESVSNILNFALYSLVKVNGPNDLIPYWSHFFKK